MGDDQHERPTTNIHAQGSVVILGDNATVVNSQGQAQQHSQPGTSTESDGPPSDKDELRVVNKVSTFVKNDYLKTFHKTNLNPLMPEKTPLEEIFVHPSLKSTDNLSASQENNNDSISLYKVFDGVCSGSTPCRMWIRAEAGKGKTMLCQKYVYDWANSQFPPSEPFDKFKIVFFLKLREVEGTLEDILEREVFCKRLTEREKQVFFLYMKKHPHDFLFILDGVSDCDLDKLSDVKDFLLDKNYKGVYLIATTRPELNHDWLEMSKAFHSHCFITGYTKENMVEFVSKYFRQHETKRKALVELITNCPDLQQLGQIPLITMLVCELWKKQNSLPTITQLLAHYTDVVLKLYKLKYRKELRSRDVLDSHEKMAMLGVNEGKTLLAEEELTECKVDLVFCQNVGFLGAEIEEGSYKFPHKLVQEYFVARWMVENWSKTETEDILQKILRDFNASARRSLLIIISGLLSTKGTKALLTTFLCRIAKCKTLADVFKESYFGEKTDLLLACVYEAAQNKSFLETEEILFKDFEPFKKTVTANGLAIPMSYNAAQGLTHVLPKLDLTKLNLSGIMFSNAAAELIATKCLQNNSLLSSVKFSHSCLYPAAVKSVCTALSSMRRLKEVDLSCCYFDDEGLKEIAKLIQSDRASITSIQLGNRLEENYMQREQVYPSQDHSDRPSIKRLDSQLKELSEFQEWCAKSLLGDEAIEALMVAVHENELEDISLPSSCVGNHFDRWLDVLSKSKTLQRIKLHLKKISQEQQKNLVNKVNNMSQLEKMSLVLEVEKSHRTDFSSHGLLENQTGGKIRLTLAEHTHSVTNPMQALAACFHIG